MKDEDGVPSTWDGALGAAFAARRARRRAAPTATHAPPAAVAAGRFALGRELARGGSGVVIAARDGVLGRDVAVKLLRVEHDVDGAQARRFALEARIAARLEHPGVAPTYGAGRTDDGRPYLLLPLLEGPTLADRLREGASVDELLVAFERMAQTVAYAHERGVVHRDLKPGNVMVGEFGDVLVVDWGLAKVLDAEACEPSTGEAAVADEPSASLAGDVLGTPGYMAPEQARGEVDRIGPPADVFALGALLCRILTGEAPFEGDTLTRLHATRLARLGPAVERLRASSGDPELVELATHCLAPLPEDRPTAAAVAACAAAALDETAQRAHRAELAAVDAEAGARRERRNRRLATAIAGLFVVALAAGAVLLRQSVEAHRARDAETRDVIAAATIDVSRLEARGDWGGVVAALENIAEIARTRAAPPEQTRETQARLTAARARAARSVQRRERDARIDALFAALEDLRPAHYSERTEATPARVRERIVSIFGEHGLDLLSRPPADLGAEYRDAPHAPDLAFLLVIPAVNALVLDPEDAFGHRLLDLAAALHPGADWPALSDALERRSPDELLEAGDRLLDAHAPAPFVAAFAQALALSGRSRDALVLLRRAHALLPQDAWIVQALSKPRVGWLATRIGSQRFATALVALRPDSPRAHADLALELARTGSGAMAAAHAARAVELEPDAGRRAALRAELRAILGEGAAPGPDPDDGE